MQAQPPPADDSDEHVLTATGEFNVHDAPIDLGVYRAEDWLAFGFFWALAGTVFLQFFTRYALNDSAGWTEEISRYLLICTVFIGATISVRKNNHIHVDIFYRYLPRPVTRVMSTFVDAFRIAFFGYAAWLTYQLMQRIGFAADGRRRSSDRPDVRRRLRRLRPDDMARARRGSRELGAGASMLERPELIDGVDSGVRREGA